MEFLKNITIAGIVLALCYYAMQGNHGSSSSAASQREEISNIISSLPSTAATPAATPVVPELQLPEKNANGFVRAIWPSGFDAKSVFIIAPLNCPSEGSKKADALAAQLTKLGIPNVRTSSFTFAPPEPKFTKNMTNPDRVAVIDAYNIQIQNEMKLHNKQMEDIDPPLVFVHNNMIRGNPTVAQVLAEFRSKPKKPSL